MEYVVPVIERLKRENGKILIFTHENPDGDGIGSMLALCSFLRKKGKNVTCAMKDPLPHIYDFLPNAQDIKKLPLDEEFDLAVLVDAAGAFRAGAPVKAKEIVRIDHHIGGNVESIYDYVDPYAPSTTTIVGRILRQWDESLIDKDIAMCLYAGLLTDTGSFRYNNVNKETFHFAEFLVDKGVNPNYMSTMIFERNRPSTIFLLKEVLSTLEMHENGKIASLVVRREFLDKTGAEEEETEGFVNFARGIDGVDVAFIMIQKPDMDTWRVSLRGKGKVNVQNIAKKLGGGGHKDAAGCRIKGKEKEVKEKILSAIKEEISKEKNQLVETNVN
ncbi:MAG: bifunctional oligoribonuclease/PAP phosphatase NrnA [Aquificae bacterium]|nr:bifunctional oligoribonuclease/PAP phosphatase NrnA [Aquificota bacterium]